MEELAWVKEQFALLQDGLRLLLLSWSRTVPALWDFLRLNSQALSNLALVVGVPFLGWRALAADRQARAANEQARVANVQAKTAEQGHITDRFTKAVEQLGSEKMAVRLGAIYALERLSKDSPEDHWTIMEVLMGYLREKATAPWALKVEAGILQTQEGEMEATSPATEHDPSDTQTAYPLTPEDQERAEVVATGVLGKAGPLKLRANMNVQAILPSLGEGARGVAPGR